MPKPKKKDESAGSPNLLARQAAVEKALETFLAGDLDADPRKSDKAIRELIIDFIAAQHGQVATGRTRSKIWEYAKSRMSNWDPDEPDLTYSAKLLRLISESQNGKTTGFADDLIRHKVAEERNKQKVRGNAPKRLTPINELLETWLLKAPDMTIEEVFERLEGATDGVIILDVCDRSVSYRDNASQDPKYLTEAGLKSRITRIRARKKKV